MDRHSHLEGRHEPTLRQVVIDELRVADLPRTLRQDLRDLYSFYLTEERREQLASMGTLKGIFWFWGWLLKSLLMKLSPTRRLLLLVALALLIWGEWAVRMGSVQLVIYTRVAGVFLILFVLMLELKDKLLATDEIEVARQVQLALLPRQHPQPAGWSVWSHTRPANEVGGDLVDYIDLGNGRLGVALGDVAGKGLGAALLMAKLQATLRAMALDCSSLADLGERLNVVLLRDGLDNRYSTLFYLQMSDDAGSLRYLNAGHNPPYLLLGDRIEDLKASCPPLGMMAGARFAEGHLELQPGESLIAYSDGVTEARDTRDEEFGAERLRALLPGLRGLPAPRAGQILLAEIERFLGETRPHDDLSLVVLTRHGPA